MARSLQTSGSSYPIVAGRLAGFFITMILLLLSTFVFDLIMNEFLIRKRLQPCGADHVKYLLHDMKRGFGMPFR
jgi:hypothetical protein